MSLGRQVFGHQLSTIDNVEEHLAGFFPGDIVCNHMLRGLHYRVGWVIVLKEGLVQELKTRLSSLSCFAWSSLSPSVVAGQLPAWSDDEVICRMRQPVRFGMDICRSENPRETYLTGYRLQIGFPHSPSPAPLSLEHLALEAD